LQLMQAKGVASATRREMRTAVFDKPGIENLRVIDNVEKPKLANPDDVLIKVKVAGVNPIDNRVVSGSIQTIRPIPHIPGAEVSGIVSETGNEVKNELKKGDKVVIYNKVFDGKCDMCLSGLDMICRNGGLIVQLPMADLQNILLFLRKGYQLARCLTLLQASCLRA
jgi:D-arabinose 1-dehydrogenase-like Zn-dependent alcohol dehydrogenase